MSSNFDWYFRQIKKDTLLDKLAFQDKNKVFLKPLFSFYILFMFIYTAFIDRSVENFIVLVISFAAYYLSSFFVKLIKQLETRQNLQFAEIQRSLQTLTRNMPNRKISLYHQATMPDEVIKAEMKVPDLERKLSDLEDTFWSLYLEKNIDTFYTVVNHLLHDKKAVITFFTTKELNIISITLVDYSDFHRTFEIKEYKKTANDNEEDNEIVYLHAGKMVEYEIDGFKLISQSGMTELINRYAAGEDNSICEIYEGECHVLQEETNELQNEFKMRLDKSKSSKKSVTAIIGFIFLWIAFSSIFWLLDDKINDFEVYVSVGFFIALFASYKAFKDEK